MSETIEVYGRFRPINVGPRKKKKSGKNVTKPVDYVIDGKKLHLRALKSLGK